MPTGTSTEFTGQLAKALQTALNSTTVKARLQALGVEPLPGTPAQMAAFSGSERDKWGRVIKQVGVRLD